MDVSVLARCGAHGRVRGRARERSLLRDAWSRARAGRRPLFVLVIPPAGPARAEHGGAWGEVLQHGSAQTLSGLASWELVCAGMPAVRTVLAGVPGVPADSCTALLVTSFEAADPDGGARAVALTVDLTLAEPLSWDDSAQERPHRDRIARLEAALAGLLDGRSSDPGRLQEVAPPGSAWATNKGCGQIEVPGHEVPGPGFLCGMGSVPEVSRKFLYYLLDTEAG